MVNPRGEHTQPFTMEEELQSISGELQAAKTLGSQDTDLERGPAQDVPFLLILWYVEKTIPNL